MLNSVVTLFLFALILWNLSNTAPLLLFGMSYSIPGYLFWAALIYAVIGTTLAHLIGRPLIALNFTQQRYEADFRFNLVRARENAEQIALLDGETPTHRLLGRFSSVVANWLTIMSRQKKLTFLTAGYGEAAVVFPFIMAAPAISPKNSTRRPDADGERLRQRATELFVLCRRLSPHRRMARGGRAAGRF